jgi:hypothetical protein
MRNSRFYPLSLLALASACVLPLACGSKDPPPNTPQGTYSANAAMGQPPPGYQPQPGYPPQGYPQQQPGQPGMQPPPGQTGVQPMPGQPGAQPTPAGSSSAPPGPLGPVGTNDPNSLSQIFAQAAAAASAALGQPGAITGDPTEAGIKLIALKAAPGMQAEGQIAKGQLQEGGHLAFMIPMQAGKCYALVGFSPPGQIADVDLNLLSPPFYNVLSGQDLTHDNAPVIGRAPNAMCPVVPLPLNYKVDIVARKGAGQVGVQLFSKSK